MATDGPTVLPTSPGLSIEEADSLMAQGFPTAFGTKTTLRVEDIVEAWGPLDATHVSAAIDRVEGGDYSRIVPVVNLKAIRHTHQRCAQLLAVGTNETVVAKLCNYTPNYISILKSDPAFIELLAYYTANVEEQWGDFVSAAAGLSMDLLSLLQETLNTNPEKFTPALALEALRTVADRSGNAPTSKTLNINVNADVGNRLDAARRRIASEVIDQQ